MSDLDLDIYAVRADVRNVKRLLAKGVNKHTINDALCYAANRGHSEIVKLLLDSGADVHVHNNCALKWGAEYGDIETVNLLLKHGANYENVIEHFFKHDNFNPVRVLLYCICKD
jgi:ankyrin repeat protein